MKYVYIGIYLRVASVLLTSKNVASQLLGPSEWKLSEIGAMKFPEIAAKFGHPAEEKDVVTEDGYILTMFHIPGDKARSVLLIHGNTPTGDCWIIRGDTALALVLARRGYDVWVINLRGTRYSRRHLYLDPITQPDRFFNYTFYELGIYDIPATIDVILRETGQKQLLAVIHSMGSSLLYVMGAEKPEYNDKIKLGISLAPISFIQHLRGLLSLLPAFGPPILGLLSLLNIQDLAQLDQVGPLLRLICLEPLGYEICIKLVFFSVVGYHPQGFEPEFAKTFFGHFPGGTSRKIMLHFLQIMQSGQFRNFDYGIRGNMIAYNSSSPPLFELSKVRMRSALLVGAEDFVATVEDAELLHAALPNVVHYEVLPNDKFNHADFVWGRLMPEDLYPSLLPLIEKYI